MTVLQEGIKYKCVMHLASSTERKFLSVQQLHSQQDRSKNDSKQDSLMILFLFTTQDSQETPALEHFLEKKKSTGLHMTPSWEYDEMLLGTQANV